jgi:hypothetical protein
MSTSSRPAQFGARARVSAGKYVTINTLRTNGAMCHIRLLLGDEPLAYHQGRGGD